MGIREIQLIYALVLTATTMIALMAVQTYYTPRGAIRMRDIMNALVSAALFVSVLDYGDLIYDRLVSEVGSHAIQIGIAVATITIGTLAHWLRGKNQTLYGLIEIAFAVASAFVITQGMSTAKGLLAQVTALVGCAYVVARGLGNVAEGRLHT